MNRILNIKFLTVFSLFLITNQASAFDVPEVEIRGFGTAGLTLSDTNLTLSDYGAFGKSENFSKLSLLGFNIRSVLTSDWEIASQLQARGDSRGFEAVLNWGFASWHPSSNFSIRAGRVPNIFWLYSQQIDVGLSFPWVILPSEVYSLTSGFKSTNGISLLTTNEFGPGILQGELIVGDGTTETISSSPYTNIQVTTNAQIKNGVGFDLKYEYDHHLTTRIGYAQGEVKVRANTTFPAGGAATSGFPTGISLNGTVITDADINRGQFFSAGSKYESDTFFAAGEIVRRLLQGTYLTQATAYYLMAGYHFGKWSPHYTFSASTGLVGTGYVHPDTALTGVLMKSSNTSNIGVNYNVNESVLVKTSFSRTHQDYSNIAANLNFNTYMLSLNFVF